MKRKVISMLLALIMSASLILPAYAANDDSAVENFPDVGVGVLTADDGTKYYIEGEVVSETANALSNEKAITYQYNISSTGGSTTTHSPDSAYASTVYLTISYRTKNTPTEYLLTGVSGHWVVTDGKASVESASLGYICSGFFPSVATQEKTGKSVKNYFSVSTGFSKYVISDYSSSLGAQLTVNYLIGTARRWSFTLENYLFK